MGLFNRKKEEPAAPKRSLVYQVDISGKAARTDIADGDEGTYFKGCHLWVEGNKMRAFQGGTLIFEITDRSKAFKELEPLVGKQLQHIVMRKKQSDYGVYYFVSVKVEE